MNETMKQKIDNIEIAFKSGHISRDTAIGQLNKAGVDSYYTRTFINQWTKEGVKKENNNGDD